METASDIVSQSPLTAEQCYHCGEPCINDQYAYNNKSFCCQGCQSVYRILNEAGLEAYYELNAQAGISLKQGTRSNKFQYLDDAQFAHKLIQFKQDNTCHITFYIPQIHCSSCIYLLERLPKLHQGIVRTDINFLKKEVHVIFQDDQTSLRAVVEKLTALGYEPHLSLNQLEKPKPKVNRQLIYRLGVAGFCFGNIMLLSFPEYFNDKITEGETMKMVFTYLMVALSLPVFFYSGNEFFKSAWAGIKHGHVNVDVPASIAIIACFVRSLVDIFFLDGAGYLDSMSGITFFMLVGRVLQAKSYAQLNFDRDYTDYFPISAALLRDGKEVPVPLPDLQTGDTIRIHHQEIIPADGILMHTAAHIDYSFVTGESKPVHVVEGDTVYAGGKLLEPYIDITLTKPVAQSYLTDLWNRNKSYKEKSDGSDAHVHNWARNFTYAVLLIALITGIYWAFNDPMKAWTSVTSILIIACPCALLLTSTFNNGYLLRLLGKNGLFLRHAYVIDVLSKLNYLVFDKTGTLTSTKNIRAEYIGQPLAIEQQNMVYAITKASTHNFSKAVGDLLKPTHALNVETFKDYPGLGVEAHIDGHTVEIGTAKHLQINEHVDAPKGTIIYLRIDESVLGYFMLQQGLRTGIADLITDLSKQLKCTLLSGDQSYQAAYLQKALTTHMSLQFNCLPQDKLNFIKDRQQESYIVGMIGDGLNDAGALKQSDVGICIAEDNNAFTPAADAILEGKQLNKLNALLYLCQKSPLVVKICFGFSAVYNFIGLLLAIQGNLEPLYAAIIMPCSTLTIVLLTYLINNYLAKKQGLKGL